MLLSNSFTLLLLWNASEGVIFPSHFWEPDIYSAQGAMEDSDSLCGARRWLATVIWSFGLPDADWSEPNFKWTPIAGNVNYCVSLHGSHKKYSGKSFPHWRFLVMTKMNEVHTSSNSWISNSCILKYLKEHSWNILSGHTTLKIQDSLEVDVCTQKTFLTHFFKL